MATRPSYLLLVLAFVTGGWCQYGSDYTWIAGAEARPNVCNATTESANAVWFFENCSHMFNANTVHVQTGLFSYSTYTQVYLIVQELRILEPGVPQLVNGAFESTNPVKVGITVGVGNGTAQWSIC
jgi:hypothetical protein